MATKRKKIVLTMKKRLEALERIDSGERIRSVADDLGVGVSTVSGWKKVRLDLEEYCSNSISKNTAEQRGTFKKPKYVSLDEALFAWYKEEHKRGVDVTGPMLQDKARILHTQLGGEGSFCASTGWLWRWKLRHGIRRIKSDSAIEKQKSEVCSTNDPDNESKSMCSSLDSLWIKSEAVSLEESDASQSAYFLNEEHDVPSNGNDVWIKCEHDSLEEKQQETIKNSSSSSHIQLTTQLNDPYKKATVNTECYNRSFEEPNTSVSCTNCIHSSCTEGTHHMNSIMRIKSESDPVSSDGIGLTNTMISDNNDSKRMETDHCIFISQNTCHAGKTRGVSSKSQQVIRKLEDVMDYFKSNNNISVEEFKTLKDLRDRVAMS